MDRLIEVRETILRLYARYSKIIDKGIQFVLALTTLIFISNNIGFMKLAANPIVTLGLSVICTFLPVAATVVAAVLLTIVQFYTLSMGVAIVAAVLFLVMFILYFRFTPDKAIILLLTPIAFALKIPMLIPIVYGLIGSPLCAVPITFGTIACYMVTYVKAYETTIKGAGDAEMLAQLSAFAQQLLNNKDMWITIIALMICLFVVYSLRKLSIDNAWKIAIVSGGLIYVIVVVIGKIAMHVDAPYVTVIIGTIVSVLLTLVLEFFVFAVDYSRTERLQFEDDEYVYYVKAVPKVTVAVPEKTVKRINERQETSKMDGWRQNFFEIYFKELYFPKIQVTDVIEIIIIAFLVYQLIVWIKHTKAWMLLRGIIVLLVFILLAAIFKMHTILWIATNSISVLATAAVVVFQPELRRALERLGQKDFWTSVVPFERSKESGRFDDKTIDALVTACYEMGKVKTGALIVVEQEIMLTEYQNTGIELDCLVSSQVLINIFEHNTPLHDGAVIVRGNRIVSATCYLPLSDNMGLSKELGTRHRAAVGMSEVSDALVIAVSEETGYVSIAMGGHLTRNVKEEFLREKLVQVQNKSLEERRFMIWKGRRKNEKQTDK